MIPFQCTRKDLNLHASRRRNLKTWDMKRTNANGSISIRYDRWLGSVAGRWRRVPAIRRPFTAIAAQAWLRPPMGVGLATLYRSVRLARRRGNVAKLWSGELHRTARFMFAQFLAHFGVASETDRTKCRARVDGLLSNEPSTTPASRCTLSR